VVGMQPAPAGRILKASAGELAEVDVEGYRAWALAGSVPAIRRASRRAPVRLLPAFDVYVAGTRPRQSLVDKRFETRVFRQAGWISPVVLVDGKAAGVWEHERTNDRVEVTVRPLGRLTSAHRNQIGEEGDRLGRFLGKPAAVTIGRGS
jgi:hypothetical protein